MINIAATEGQTSSPILPPRPFIYDKTDIYNTRAEQSEPLYPELDSQPYSDKRIS